MRYAIKICIQFIAFAFLLFLSCKVIKAQNDPSKKINAKIIIQAFDTIRKSRNDSIKFIVNNRILKNIFSVLTNRDLENIHLDSVKSLVRITSEDRKIQFFHWNLQEESGRHHYFGFVRVSHDGKTVVYNLHDIADSISDAQSLVSGPEAWVGALYYKIIDVNNERGGKFYTLLGWSGQDIFVTAKVIDILFLTRDGIPKFGLPVFKNYPNGAQTRIIFRFSASATMALKYEEQVVSVQHKWNSRKREFESSEMKAWMIVADRLVPPDPMLEGQYQYYIPSGEFNDGFIMEKGFWMYIQNIETRNTSQ